MMTSIVIPVLAVVALAVAYGFVRPRAGCGANCDTCTHACTSAETDDHHVA
jgi:hypothetical protein